MKETIFLHKIFLQAIERMDSQEIRNEVKWSILEKLETCLKTSREHRFEHFDLEERDAMILAFSWMRMHYQNEIHYTRKLITQPDDLVKTYKYQSQLVRQVIKDIMNANSFRDVFKMV